jgi:hypothetical protein
MKIDVYHHHHGLGLLEAFDRMLRALLTLDGKVTRLMATIDEVLAEITSQTSKIEGIDALLDGLRAQVQELLDQQGNIPPALQEKIDAVFDTAKANTAAIDAAIAENTPPASPV